MLNLYNEYCCNPTDTKKGSEDLIAVVYVMTSHVEIVISFHIILDNERRRKPFKGNSRITSTHVVSDDPDSNLAKQFNYSL